MGLKNLPKSLIVLIVITVVIMKQDVMTAEVVVIVGPGFAYDPKELEINVGDTVVWKWAYPLVPFTTVPHTVTKSLSFENKCEYIEDYEKQRKGVDFHTGIQMSGFEFKYTFTKPEHVTYHCESTGRSCLNCNLGMWAQVNVVESGAKTVKVNEKKYKLKPDVKIIDKAQGAAVNVLKNLFPVGK